MLSERQAEILALIETEGAQYIDALAQRYGLTTQTIRRDINYLCDRGYARRFHGGVTMLVEGRNISANARFALNSGAKQQIARRIAAEIPEGSTVFMGIGTSVQYVAEALRDHRDLTVVTNNIDVALTLGDAKHLEVQLTGGIYRPDDRDMVGLDVIQYFEKFRATCCVVGTGALEPDSGLLEFSYEEAQVTAAIIANAEMRFLAADVTKWGRGAAVKVVPLNRMTRFFTDRLPDDPDITATVRASGVDLVLCGPEAS
ncbi:MAG TPA: DeoR/GlpR family DNA-binding transcription regulator [Devosiaceae bacterium]|jgi:DeoR family glycerol-3-phosphate regulon repressor